MHINVDKSQNHIAEYRKQVAQITYYMKTFVKI